MGNGSRLHVYRMSKFNLRWRFVYKDKPDRFGVWDYAGECPTTRASCQSTQGLARAIVEGKNILTRETVVLADISGQDFMLFQWIKVDHFSGGGLTPSAQYMVGMKVVTRYGNIIVNNDGTLNRTPLSVADRTINFAAY